jgi:hypothetical protein
MTPAVTKEQPPLARLKNPFPKEVEACATAEGEHFVPEIEGGVLALAEALDKYRSQLAEARERYADQLKDPKAPWAPIGGKPVETE